ncbi:hypothetical protein SLA2020_389680 [Shorea laevis]
MLRWGFKGETNCVFCRNGLEDRNHLFFYCGFSKRIWRNSMAKCNVADPPILWDEVLSMGIQHWMKKTLSASLAGWSWEPPFTTYGGPVMKLDMMGFLILKTNSATYPV